MHPKHASAGALGEHDWVAGVLAAPDKAVLDVVQAMSALGYRVGTSSETVAREITAIISGGGRDQLRDLVIQVIAALMDEGDARAPAAGRCEYALTERPWIVIACPSDELVRTGRMAAKGEMTCCICGAVREWEYELLPPEWWLRGVDPARFFADTHAAGDAWMSRHVHAQLCDKSPALFWARPLLNPRAWSIDWQAIGRRLFEDLGWQRGPLH